MSPMKTPGVYIPEKNTIPNSVIEAATAVPAFIGYTEKASNGETTLTNIPFKINSLAEYEKHFGGAPKTKFSLKEETKDNDNSSSITTDLKKYSNQTFLNNIKISTLNDFLRTAVQAQTEWENAADEKIEMLKKSYAEKYENAVNHISEYLHSVGIFTDALKSFTIESASVDNSISFQISDIKATLVAPAKKATDLSKQIDNLIASLKEYNFTSFDDKQYSIQRSDHYTLYYNLQFFFANGGGPSYIVSVGGYDKELNRDTMINAIDTLLQEREPTMVIIPESVNLSEQECYDVQNSAADHCGNIQNRITIMNVYNGYKDRKDPSGDAIATFREKTVTPFLNYSTAYYPWLNTSIVSEKDISFENIVEKDIAVLQALLILSAPDLDSDITRINSVTSTKDSKAINETLFNQHPLYSRMIKEMTCQINLLPPAAAMAGIYTLTDNTREVWKAPANIALSNVISTAVNISNIQQEDLNAPLDGKAMNAIRSFAGEGILVWGARTLDANSLDWKYINVRRTMIMLEESIKNTFKTFIFEPNTVTTWVFINSMIRNFLTGIWKRGGLAGPNPDEAFSVHIGLGDTMNPEDILEGIMRLTVCVAIIRPAEFIEITFQQQMQKS